MCLLQQGPVERPSQSQWENSVQMLTQPPSQDLKKNQIKNYCIEEMSTRSGSNLVLRIPIKFYSHICNNV
jgi:hypothetical protein